MKFIDLHTHSSASDGDYTPTRLVALAVKAGLSALSLTDHDTVSGDAEAEMEAQKAGLEFAPGVEISCDFDSRSFHILGYWIDYRNHQLITTLKLLVDYRNRRNYSMIEKLRELGIRIDYGEVQAVAGKEIVGRPHFAQILVQKGVVGSVKGAFEQYLGSGKPAYIRKKRLIAEEGIQLIRDAGGVPCLAHPALYGFKDDGELEVVISRLKSFGMEGIETYYSTHTQNQTELYKQLAEKYGLVECGGSDFHGSAKPEIKLGRGIEDNLKIGWDIYLNLHQRHQKLHAHYASNRIK